MVSAWRKVKVALQVINHECRMVKVAGNKRKVKVAGNKFTSYKS